MYLFKRSLVCKNSNLKKYSNLWKNQNQYPNSKKKRFIHLCRERRRNKKWNNRSKKIIIYFMMYSAKDATKDPSKIYCINVVDVRSWIFASYVLRKLRIRSYIHLLKLEILRQLQSMLESILNSLLSKVRKRRSLSLKTTNNWNIKRNKRESNW